MGKTIVINETIFDEVKGGFDIETIIDNGEVSYFVIAKSIKANERNWEVLRFSTIGEIFEEFKESGLDYKVNYKYMTGEVFATFGEYCRWFNERYSSESVETIYA